MAITTLACDIQPHPPVSDVITNRSPAMDSLSHTVERMPEKRKIGNTGQSEGGEINMPKRGKL